MSLNQNGFFYRRLGKYFPCVLPGIGKGVLPLGSKYDVASARDVFFSAHYWRLFEYLEREPKLIVDLGAHCGHFSLLCHLLLLEKFGCDNSSYILVEPVKSLLELASKNLQSAGLLKQCELHRGLVGLNSGVGSLSCNEKNLLASSVHSSSSEVEELSSASIPYLNLNQLIPRGQNIDVLKIDIEGSEQDFLKEYPEILVRTKILLIELHGDQNTIASAQDLIVGSGMKEVSSSIWRSAELMCIYTRQ